MALDLPPQPRTFTLSMLEEGLELSVSVRLLELPSPALAPLCLSARVEPSDACSAAFAVVAPWLAGQLIAMHAQALQFAYDGVVRAIDREDRLDREAADRRRASKNLGEVSPKDAPAAESAP